MSEQVEMDSIPQCDLCNDGTPAKYDARLPGLGGSWGNVCQRHWMQYGPHVLGTGSGQRLVLRATS
jgi:hypothetical protein